MTPVGNREVALLIGKAPAPDVAIVAADTGRILRRFPAPHQLTSLAASPDGQTLYASAAGKISALPRSGGAARPLGDGDSVTVDPQSGDLIVKIDLRDRYTLMRIPAAGGNAQPIPYEGDFGLTVMPLMPAAVWNGQLALALSSVDSYNWHLGTLDVRTGKVTRHASDYVTDSWFVTRAAGSHALVGAGLGLDATLWKFSPARQ